MSDANKRLRLAETDLEITCQQQGGASDAPEGASSSKTYHYHSVVMAMRSKYFDTSLTSGLEESVTKKFVLEDVSPETFELAMSLLEDPAKANAVSPAEVLQVAPFYNRFMFDAGTKLVEIVLLKFLVQWTPEEKPDQPLTPFDMDCIVEAIAYANSANHELMIEKAKKFWKQRIGSRVWSTKHIRKIQAFIIERCADITNLYLGRFFEYEEFSEEDRGRLVKDPDFPSFLARKFAIINDAAENYRPFVALSLRPKPIIRVHISEEWHQGQHWFEPDCGESGVVDLSPKDIPAAEEFGEYLGRNGLSFEEKVNPFEENNQSRGEFEVLCLERCPNVKFLEQIAGGSVCKDKFQRVFHEDDWFMVIKESGFEPRFCFAAPLSRNEMLPPTETNSWVALDDVDVSRANLMGDHETRLRVRLEHVWNKRNPSWHGS